MGVGGICRTTAINVSIVIKQLLYHLIIEKCSNGKETN